ncbi:hypothetical protein LN040_12840 [Desulfovibrio subterraneus]|jgi:hypothetical protein|uniref:Uncharacterized protein n=1 Tax=Desulfovibrio subterraneus TaxID=2718620 RepID=A0A7J0BM62_9BACT|nr:hypothetical protein [Desulfovibrio subterraneus]WBF66610.1 hypothetical protein LN040_12840 [Desulfovibrio subterraneus]GFM34729.1 hypothetical protein DSM101010T_30940 [Desulfovibrio subterraneus]
MSISATMYRDGSDRLLTPEEEEQKRIIYEQMNPRRRKYVDRIGYDKWDPFQKPNDPMELRMDISKRTTQQLVREFLQNHKGQYSNDYGRGALETAVGIINRDEKVRGVFDFCVWYYNLLIDEGYTDYES